MKIDNCAYLNDIKGCSITAVYRCGDSIELQYKKDGIPRYLTIKAHVYGGSMGHGSFFELSNAQMPQQLFKGELACTKQPLDKLNDMVYIEEVSLHRQRANGYGDMEEIGIVYHDKNGKRHHCLFSFDGDEECFAPSIEKEQESTLPQVDCSSAAMPNDAFSMSQYKKVLSFALKAHGEQKTPQGLPYAFHIVSVAQEIIASLSHYRLSYDDANVAIACALLHDVLEDTDTTIGANTLDVPNIDIILQGVQALTKDTSLPTKEVQMKDSLMRIKLQPKSVQAVKLADRITNLDPAPDYWNRSKRESYKQEAKEIYESLKEANPYLAQRLLYKITNYQVEKDDNYLIFFNSQDAKIKLILDKNRPEYLQTFKALKVLFEYVKKQYGITLFQNDFTDAIYQNFSSLPVLDDYERVDISYIVNRLNEQRLLDLNQAVDTVIESCMRTLFENEVCFV